MPAEAAQSGELPRHYYLSNFLRLCDTAEGHYGDLLLAEEKAFLAQFRELEFASQCLYVRLISRVGPLFRVEKLRYEEIGALEVPLAGLVAGGFVEEVGELELEQLGKLYTHGELQALFQKKLAGGRFTKKSELLEAIGQLGLERDEYLSLVVGASEAAIVSVCGEQVLELLQLLFFGNQYQSLTDFILSDLGVASYYPYTFTRKSRLFGTRVAVEEYLSCGNYKQLFTEMRESSDAAGLVELGKAMLHRDIRFDSSRRRWDRLCTRVARELERAGEFPLAFDLYGQSGTHPARERRARILEAQKDWSGALSVCETIIGSPWGSSELEAAERIKARVTRKTGGAKAPRRRDAFEESHLRLARSDEGVELAVVEHLAGQWESVHFLENNLMNSVFGLAFWEQIFADVPGVFHNPYQSVPADMYGPQFRQRRVEHIEARIRDLAAVNLRQELLACHQRYRGYQCRWVNWYRVDEDLLDHALGVIPAEHLFAIWRRQLLDPAENRNGFPDLIALGRGLGDYRMIEVKGPGDRLQDNQKRWLRYFAAHDIPASVAWVEWDDV